MAFAVAALIWSVQQVGRPMPGFVPLLSGHVDAYGMSDWTGAKAGIRPGDRILAYDQRRFVSSTMLHRYVRSLPVGTPIHYTLVRAARGTVTTHGISVPTQRLSVRDWGTMFGQLWLMGFFHLVIGAAVKALRPKAAAARAHWWFCLSIALFDFGVSGNCLGGLSFGFVANAGEVMVAPTALQLAALLPRPWPIVSARPWLWRVLRMTSLGLALMLLKTVWVDKAYWASPGVLLYAMAGFLTIPASTAWVLLSRTSTAYQRHQARVILIGSAVATFPCIVVLAIGNLVGVVLPFQEYTYLTLVFFPLAIAYGIVRHRLFDIPLILRRTTQYVVLISVLGAVYVAMTALGYTVLGWWSPAIVTPSLPGFAAAVVVAMCFQSVHDGLRRWVDRVFLGEQIDTLQVLSTAVFDATIPPIELAKQITEFVRSTLHTDWVVLRLNQVMTVAAGPAPISVVSPTAGGGDGPDPGVEDLLVVALRDGHRHLGDLLVGPKANRHLYRSEEHDALRILTVHAAASLQRSYLQAEHLQLAVRERAAQIMATDHERVLGEVVADLEQELAALRAATLVVETEPSRAEGMTAIRTCLTRINALVDEKTRWVTTATVSATPLLLALDRSVGLVSASMTAKRQHLDVSFAGADVAVLMDPMDLVDLVVALLEQAIEASPEGATVTLQVAMDGGLVVVSVDDQGPSLPPHVLADDGGSGHGLGLTRFANRLAAAGGRLSFHDQSPGTRVAAHLRAAPVGPAVLS